MSLQAQHPKLLLASASPARSQLLCAAGLTFEARAAGIDEVEVRRLARIWHISDTGMALRLASLKAEQIARAEPEAIVIGCDQLLVCAEQWFEKPADTDAARIQLRALRGRSHTLVTAVVCQQGEQRLWQHVAQPQLTMRAFSDAFLEEYLALEEGRVTGTVGAYRLEGPGVHLFEAIDGEHSAILGLPLLPLLDFLRRQGVVVG